MSIEESRDHLSKSKTEGNDLNSKCSSLLGTDEISQNVTIPTPVSVPTPAPAQQENLLLDFFSEPVATSAPEPILASTHSENSSALVPSVMQAASQCNEGLYSSSSAANSTNLAQTQESTSWLNSSSNSGSHDISYQTQPSLPGHYLQSFTPASNSDPWSTNATSETVNPFSSSFAQSFGAVPSSTLQNYGSESAPQIFIVEMESQDAKKGTPSNSSVVQHDPTPESFNANSPVEPIQQHLTAKVDIDPNRNSDLDKAMGKLVNLVNMPPPMSAEGMSATMTLNPFDSRLKSEGMNSSSPQPTFSEIKNRNLGNALKPNNTGSTGVMLTSQHYDSFGVNEQYSTNQQAGSHVVSPTNQYGNECGNQHGLEQNPGYNTQAHMRTYGYVQPSELQPQQQHFHGSAPSQMESEGYTGQWR